MHDETPELLELIMQFMKGDAVQCFAGLRRKNEKDHGLSSVDS
jgi:hypothetical protein